MSEHLTQSTFEGFIPPTKNFFHMPNQWLDICADIKNLAEMKVVQYVLRHTWGFREYGIAKTISVDEFMKGRRRGDGTRMDKGTGLSHHSVIDGLKAAINHGYLVCEVDTSDLARVKKSYALKMFAPGEDVAPPEDIAPGEESTASSEDVAPPPVKILHPPMLVGGEESSDRSEKDTIERHLKKDTIEKKSDSASPSKKSKNPLTLQGQHILDVYQTFKGRKSTPGKATIDAANGLADMVANDEELLQVLTEIRDNQFLNDKQVPRDLDFVLRKYERYRDLAEQKKHQQNGLNGHKKATIPYGMVMWQNKLMSEEEAYDLGWNGGFEKYK